jgi:hypothetical protein
MSAHQPPCSISVEDLRKATERAFSYMEQAGIRDFRWERDSYWLVDEADREDLQKPPELWVLNYSDDARDVRSLAAGDMIPTPFSWESIAVLLLAMSVKHKSEG